MRVSLAIFSVALLSSCGSGERREETINTTDEPVEDLDSSGFWFAPWEAQRARYGGGPPSPQEIRKTGRPVFFLRPERAADTNKRMYSMSAYDALDGDWKLFESFEGVMEWLAPWEDRAAIYYFMPCTISSTSFTLTEFTEIQSAFEDKGYELILDGG